MFFVKRLTIGRLLVALETTSRGLKPTLALAHPRPAMLPAAHKAKDDRTDLTSAAARVMAEWSV